MPLFQYEATDTSGNEVTDVIEASSARQAQTLLQDQGFFISELNPVSRNSSSADSSNGSSSGLHVALILFVLLVIGMGMFSFLMVRRNAELEEHRAMEAARRGEVMARRAKEVRQRHDKLKQKQEELAQEKMDQLTEETAP